jgi:lanthanide-dependent methanol dehydrogenase
MSAGTLRGQEGQPLVVGDTLYFESSYPNYIYAVNLNDIGQMVWKYTPTQDNFAPSIACCDLVSRGLAYADGKILADTLDGQVLALDAKSGALVWKTKNVDPELGQSMTSAPLVVHDHFIVGVSGCEYGRHSCGAQAVGEQIQSSLDRDRLRMSRLQDRANAA